MSQLANRVNLLLNLVESNFNEFFSSEISYLKVLENNEPVSIIKVAGIDEAGRGPVIGPMVMAGVSIPARSIPYLMELNIKDSKELSKVSRIHLVGKTMDIVNKLVLAVIPPRVIDNWVKDHGLNRLEAYVSSQIIQKFLIEDRYIYIDAPSTSESFMEYLRNYLGKNFFERSHIIVEPKADKSRITVSLASIYAKVFRDLIIDELKRNININIGSGYPSDPHTRKTLEIVKRRFPEAIRYSWKSVKKNQK